MIAVLSPAKSLDFSPAPPGLPVTEPRFMAEAATLIAALRGYSALRLSRLMDISRPLAELNRQRYQDWRADAKAPDAKQALLAFDGDVYQGFTRETYKAANFAFAQKHLRILSGLYGVLRPLDAIEAHRLEMGTAVRVGKTKTLYAFWKERVAEALNHDLAQSGSKVLINLASNEYFSVVESSRLDARVISCVFLDEKRGSYKIVSFFAKKARGLMADFIVRNRIKTPAGLRAFCAAGYVYDHTQSSAETLVFKRPA